MIHCLTVSFLVEGVLVTRPPVVACLRPALLLAIQDIVRYDLDVD